jgi:hypothetical protein
VKDALLAKANGLHVAASIEDSEGVPIQQDSCAVVGECRGCTDVELMSDFNDVLVMLFLYRWKHR